MMNNVYLGIIAVILSLGLSFIIQKIFIKYNKFDGFNHRTSHKTLATRTGGISVFLTLFIISSFYYLNDIEIYNFSLLVPLSIMFLVGFYDDFYNADFKLKFLMQIIVAKIIIDQGFIKVPSFRSDVKTQNDLAEEVARVIGYNNIPTSEISIPRNKKTTHSTRRRSRC